jgi:hypothetical protein
MIPAAFAGQKKYRITVLLFFAVYLIVGLRAYKQYGISWDEPVSRERGILTLRYVVQGDRELIQTDWKYHHGAACEMPLAAAEAVLRLSKNPKSVYLARHLLTFLLFYTSVIFFYFLGNKCFHRWYAGLLGCVFLVLSPRIFAHSFYNPKDIPFLSLFIIALYSMIVFLDSKTWWRALCHALACALLIDVRIVGAVIPLLTFGFLGFEYLRSVWGDGNKKVVALCAGLSILGAMALAWCMLPGSLFNRYLGNLAGPKSAAANLIFLATTALFFFFLSKVAISGEGRTAAASAAVFVVGLGLFTTLFWPILWSNPIGEITKALSLTKTFPWPYTILYRGTFTASNSLPWHYLPVWICISTPFVYSILFLIGYCRIAGSAIAGPWQFFIQKRQDFIFFVLVTAVIGGTIIFKPVLYDDWRQMYFIYPVFLLIAVGGLMSLLSCCRRLSHQAIRKTIILIVVSGMGISLIWTAKTMAGMHPFQNVYFNRLAGESMDTIKSNYDLDYWGVSYRQALEYIVAHDQNTKIALFAANYPAKANANMLDEKDRKRLVFVNKLEDACYFVGNYRWHKEEYSQDREYFSVQLDGTKIVAVYKVTSNIAGEAGKWLPALSGKSIQDAVR